MRRFAFIVAVAIALTVLGGSAVEGSPITYYFGGTFDGGVGPFESLADTPFLGQFVYDPAWQGQAFGVALPAGAFTLATVNGNYESTSGRVGIGLWSISTSAAISVEPIFDSELEFEIWGLVLRGPWGSADPWGSPPSFPADLTGWSWNTRMLEVYNGLHGPDEFGMSAGYIDCVTTDAGGCGAPVPEPTSMLLFGTGLVGLRAWRKRRR